MSTQAVAPTLVALTGTLTLGAKQAAKMFGLSLSTWRRHDSSGRIPRGFKIVGRKLWRASDLNLWAEWGFPTRQEFERRLEAESSNGGRGDGR